MAKSKVKDTNVAELFFESSETMLCALDKEGVILDLNPRAEEIIGSKEGAAIGKVFSQFIFSEGMQETFSDYLELVQATNKARILHVEFGTTAKKLQRIRLHLQNNTKQKVILVREAGESIIEEDVYVKILESSSQFNIITDAKGIILYQNKKVLGLDKKKTLNTSIFTYIDEAFVKPMTKALDKTFKTGDSHSLEVQSKTKDGNLAWYELQFSPAQIEKGKVKTVNLNFSDITATKEISENLHRSEELYRLLVQQIPRSVVLVTDENMRYILIEGTDIESQGFDKGMIGKTPAEALGQERGKRHEVFYKQALKGESVSTDANRENRHYRINIEPLLNSNGKPAGTITVSLDATDLQQAKSELQARAVDLQKSNDDLELFAYVASHELQEPLRMIGNFVQLLEKRYQDKVDTRGKTYIKFTVDGVAKMSKLIQDLLVYSRVGRLEGSIEDLYSEKIVELAIKDIESEIKDRKAKVEMQKMPVGFKAEKNQMIVVFQNLILNGIIFNDKPKPHVRISGKENASHYAFEVRDNGIGIEKSFHPKVFTVFQKLHSKEEYPGSGIGLALTKKIIKRHGGEIWFDTKMGKGTVFHFTISKSII